MRTLCLDAFHEAIHRRCAKYGVSTTEKLNVRFEQTIMNMHGRGLYNHSLGVHTSSRLMKVYISSQLNLIEEGW